MHWKSGILAKLSIVLDKGVGTHTKVATPISMTSPWVWPTLSSIVVAFSPMPVKYEKSAVMGETCGRMMSQFLWEWDQWLMKYMDHYCLQIK